MTEPATEPGKQPHRKIVTDEIREAIRTMYVETDISASAIAKRFGITPETVGKIGRGLRPVRSATPKADAWWSTTRKRKPRPLCDRCAAGDHRPSDHGELGCLFVVRDYACGCLHGATVDVMAPINDGKRVEMCINPKTAVARKRRAA